MSDDQSSTRRQVLRVSAVGAVASMAGCLGSGESNLREDIDGVVTLAQEYYRDKKNGDSPPVFAEGDPGRNSYPRNPQSAEEELLGSKGIEDQFYRLYTQYRRQNDAEELYPNASLESGARKHSYDMATRSYVGPEGPNGEDPVAKYEPLQVSCSAVDSLVHKTSVTVIDNEGSRTGVTETDVATSLFSVFRDDEDMSKALLLPKVEAAAAGVGVYLTPQDQEGTREVVDTYVTVDICHGFESGTPTLEE